MQHREEKSRTNRAQQAEVGLVSEADISEAEMAIASFCRESVFTSPIRSETLEAEQVIKDVWFGIVLKAFVDLSCLFPEYENPIAELSSQLIRKRQRINTPFLKAIERIIHSEEERLPADYSNLLACFEKVALKCEELGGEAASSVRRCLDHIKNCDSLDG